MRRNTEGFAGFSGMLTLVSFVEFGQVNQFVPNPAPAELVCTSKRQPRWFAGQLKIRLPPLTLLVMANALVLTVNCVTSTV